MITARLASQVIFRALFFLLSQLVIINVNSDFLGSTTMRWHNEMTPDPRPEGTRMPGRATGYSFQVINVGKLFRVGVKYVAIS